MLAEMAAHTRCSCNSVIQHSASSGLLSCCADQGLGSLIKYLAFHSIDAKKRSLLFSGRDTQLHLVCCVAVQDKAQQSERMMAELPAHIRCSCNSVLCHSASSGLLRALCCLAIQDKAHHSKRMLAEMAAHIQQLQQCDLTCSLIWSAVLLFRTKRSSLNACCCLAVQDKAQQSERMLAEMAAQMQQLRVEKEELQGRNKLLESLLKVQQQQQHDSSGGRRLDASQVWVQFVLYLSC